MRTRYFTGSKSLFVQLAVTIIIFIALIEGILLATSYHAKSKELTQLNTYLEQSIEQRYSLAIKDPLDQEFINNRLNKFIHNIIALTLLIISVVVIGTLLVFHYIAGRHLKNIIEFNQKYESGTAEVFPEDEIPNNEIGQLIKAQNEMIKKLEKNKEKAVQTEREIRDISTFSSQNPGPVLRINEFGFITQANPAAIKTFGVNLAENTQLGTLLPSVEKISFHLIRKYGGSFQSEVNYKDRYFLMQFVGIPEASSINIYGVDITEEKQLQAKVFQSSKLASIGELAAGVGHEINNPLAIIKGNVEILCEKIEKGHVDMLQLSETMKTLNRSTLRITKIVDGLRNYARVDSESEVPVDSHKAISETFDLVAHIYSLQKVQLKKSLKAHNYFFKGNTSKFQQVLLNFLSNAKDSIPDKQLGEVTISTKNCNGELIISISDNGCGISTEDQEKIFESFYTTKSRGQGTGLGLGIAQSIIHGMDGNISVESEMGKGTSFSLHIPTCEGAEQATPEVKTESSNVFSGLNILLVEDEPEILEILQAALKRTGAEIDTAEDGRKAASKINKDHFDLVISDMNMPNMDGVELLKMSKKLHGNRQRFILITGGDNPGDISPQPPDAVLFKPFSRSKMIETINDIINKNSQNKRFTA